MVTPPPIQLGNLGMADSLILMVLALVVFGPRRLPQIGRQIGKLMYEFRKASNDFKFQMEEELRLAEDADRRKKEEEERARNLALNPPAPAVEAQAAIGADEQASVSAPSGLYTGSLAAEALAEATPEVGEPTAAPAEEEEQQIRYPRINPPSSGAPVPAAPPQQRSEIREQATGNREQGTENSGAESSVAAEANIGAEPAAGAAPAQESSSEPTSSEPTPTEPVSQHG